MTLIINNDSIVSLADLFSSCEYKESISRREVIAYCKPKDPNLANWIYNWGRPGAVNNHMRHMRHMRHHHNYSYMPTSTLSSLLGGVAMSMAGLLLAGGFMAATSGLGIGSLLSIKVVGVSLTAMPILTMFFFIYRAHKGEQKYLDEKLTQKAIATYMLSYENECFNGEQLAEMSQ